jgi:predicted proteasome-type protease
MKKIIALTGLALIASAPLFAQPVQKEKKEVIKNVEVQEVNGEKVMTITTTENGVQTQEVVKGAEAEQRMQEFPLKEEGNEVRKEVNYEEVNGEKVLTIMTTENGVTSTEVYKGAEAEMKLKEIQEGVDPAAAKKKELQNMRFNKTEVQRKN